MQPRHQCASMVGRWRISPPPFLAFLGLLLVLTLGVILDAAPTLAEEVKQKNVKESWTRLNTSGRTISFAVPVKDAEVELGEVTIQITADDKILIQKAEFAEHAEPVVGAAVAQKITAMADVSGFVAVEQFEAAGAGVRFDFGLQELQLTLSPDQRPTGDLNIGGHPTQQISADLTEPAFISGYLNIIAGLDQDWSQNRHRRKVEVISAAA